MNIILKNASYLFVSNILIRFLSAISSILVARYLGPINYGVLSIGLAFSSIAGYFTDLGLSHTFIREASKDYKKDLSKLVSSHFKIKVIFAVLTSITIYFIVELFYGNKNIREVIYLMTFPTIFGSVLQGVGASYFQAIQQMKYTAYIRSFSGLITVISLIIGIILKLPLNIIAPFYGFSSLIGGIYSLYLLSKRISIIKGWDNAILTDLLSFSAGGLFLTLLPQIPPIILEKVTTLREVGAFSAAYRIPAVLYQFPGVIASAFYPLLFNYGSLKKFYEHTLLSINEAKLMTTLGGCMVIPFILYSEWWVKLIFGSEWTNIASLLSILSLILFLQSINYPLADSLTTRGYQSRRSVITFISLLIAIILYYILGSSYGALGGAFSAIIIEITLLVGLIIFNDKSKQILLKGVLRQTLLLVALLIGALKIRNQLHPLLGSMIFIFFYLIFIIISDREVLKLCKEYLKVKNKKN